MTDRAARLRAAFYLNLEQQKNRAKDLLRAVKARDPQALQRLAAVLPHRNSSGAAESRAKLADAQFAIARELRFESWAKLKAHIARMDRQREAIERKQPAPDGAMKTVHMRCGSDIRDKLASAGFAGDFLQHINPYCQGPVTNGPDYYEKRARFVVEAFTQNPPSYESIIENARREDADAIKAADDYERVVIWAEHDNFDQLMLIRVLSLFQQARKPQVLELISVNEFPGGLRFIGLGQLPPEALRMLWATRKPVTSEMLAFGDRAWDALRSEDPRQLSAIAQMDPAPLPHLPGAVHRHLQELPWVGTGLGLTEQLVLRALALEQSCTINRIFEHLYVHGMEPLPYMGDAGLAHVIRTMEKASEPVFVRTREQPDEREFRNRLTITELGHAVLRGERDWHSLNPPERWVGGVRISPQEKGWRWDDARRQPVR
jgi:Domain of unknown function (DUF1835)